MTFTRSALHIKGDDEHLVLEPGTVFPSAVKTLIPQYVKINNLQKV